MILRQIKSQTAIEVALTCAVDYFYYGTTKMDVMLLMEIRTQRRLVFLATGERMELQ